MGRVISDPFGKQKTTDVGLDNWPIIEVKLDSICIHCGKIIPKGKKAQYVCIY